MEQSFLMMVSNLLHLQNSLDPSELDPSSSAAAPLLFFAIASVLSFAASGKKKPPAAGDCTLAAFRALSTEHIWSLEAPLRDAQWRSLYGLSHPVFTTVVEKLRPHIALSSLSLPPDYAVAMVLSRLAHGLSARAAAARYSLDPFLVSKITNMVTRLLATKLYPEFIKVPVGRRRLADTTRAFQDLSSLPNVAGAIDSSAVPRRPRRSPAPHAVLLPVVADRRRLFWDVCVKAPASSDDASHFRDSLLYSRLTSGDVAWDRVVSVHGTPVRPYLVADWCYPLAPFLLTPFSRGGAGTPAQNLFDAMLIKARSAVVDALGLLKARWRILRDLNVGLTHAPQTIVACCVLHNLCQVAQEPEPDIWKEPDEQGGPPRVLDSEKSLYYMGDSLRQLLADDLYHRLSSNSNPNSAV